MFPFPKDARVYNLRFVGGYTEAQHELRVLDYVVPECYWQLFKAFALSNQ